MIKKVDVLGQKYKIIMSNKGITKDILDTCHGYCMRDEGLIWINPKLNLEHSYRTLFHEMGHAVMYRNGVAFSGSIPMELEEILVETFSSMQYEFLIHFLKGMLNYEDDILRREILSFIRGKS